MQNPILKCGWFGTLALGLIGSFAGCSSSPTVEPAAALGTPPMTIVLDGSMDDWPSDEVAVGDDQYLYLRFSPVDPISLQSYKESLVIALDTDDSPATGEALGDLGIDLEIAFSPPREDGTPGRGTRITAISPEGERVRLPAGLLDISVAPTHAASWFEMRIARRMPSDGVLPEAGLLSSGRVRGRMSMYNASGRRVAEAPEFFVDLPQAAADMHRAHVSVPRKSLGTVRIVSYNVLNATPMDKPEPFSRMLRALDPDIVLVQEWYNTPADEMAAWFNRELPIEGQWRAVTSEGRGVAVVSRLEIAPIGPPALVIQPEGEDRTVRVTPALVETPIGPMAVASIHLKCCGSLNSREDRIRNAEAEAIAAMIEEQTADIGPHVRVVIGDCNLVGGRDPLLTLARRLDVDRSNASIVEPYVLGDNAMYTWTSPTSNFLPGRLDYAVYSDSSAVIDHAFIFDPARLSDKTLHELNLQVLDGMASDHRPLVLDLRAP